MAEIQDELLAAACERIWAYEHPAYVKNSELRYLAVNAAFARLFNLQPSDIVGLRGDEIGEATGHEDRQEHERRCLVFGNAERARYFHPFGGGSFTIAMERQRLSGDVSIVTGIFTPSTDILASSLMASELRLPRDEDGLSSADLQRVRDALESLDRPVAIFAEDGRELVVNAAYRERGEAPEREPDTVVENALDVMGAGVAIFGADDRLTYVNRSMREFYRVLLGDTVEGALDLPTLTAALYDMEVGPQPDGPGDKAAWVEARLRNYGLPLFESVARTAGGWMRLVTQRRPDGVLVALRMDVTALKENEGRLHKHTQEISLYRALLDELPVASFMRDESQRMIFANRAYQMLIGQSAEELIGKTTRDMFPLQGDEFHQENQRVLDSGTLIESEVIYRRPDGTVVPTISRLYRVTTIDEKNYLIGSITDTSVLKKREDQLIVAQHAAEAAKSDLESIVESLQVGIVVVDDDSVIELVNGAFEALWDGALPALKGKPLAALLRFQQARAAAEPGATECSTHNHDEWFCAIRSGEFSPREVTYATGRTLIEAGQPISGGRCLLTYIDITERREREREVLETRSALEDIGRLVKDALSSMSQGLMIIDSGCVVLVNEALHGMVTLPPHLLEAGAALADIFRHCVEKGVYGIYDGRRVEAAEFEVLLRPDRNVSLTIFSGLSRWLQLDSTPTGHGRMVLVFSDITELKAREEQLQQLVLRAETADKAKSEFLANMSHEIRTPMNGVLGMAELLAKSSLDTRQKTFIDIMVKSGNALLTIINDILDFSKIDAGQMTLRKMPFNLVEAIEDVATLLSTRAAEKDIELVVRGAADMPASVVGDAGRFRQIVTNLVGNAVKFTDRGHVLIAMRAAPGEDNCVTITLTIEDTGAGIPSEKLSSVFEKFSQIDSSSTRRHEGTGLGLAITDGLVRLFGGTLDVSSTVGSGSTFTVTLPMALDRAGVAKRTIPANIRGARVLVVDAHDVTRETACSQLADWGFDVTAVAASQEAIDLIDAACSMGVPVETVVVDRHMEDAGGGPLASAIRTFAPDVGMVVLSSLNEPHEGGLLDALDIDAHLMKPVRAELLRETVCDVVRAARANGSAVPAKAVAAHATALPAPAEAPTVGPDGEEAVDVLVAEDNEVNQILFTQLLEGAGVSFHIVANGVDAVEAFARLRPRMILMDVSMPVMNGHQAAGAIREREKILGTRVPIVAVTAHVLDGDHETCLASGMDDYLVKPISAEKLEDAVHRWLEAGHSSGARRATLH